MMKDNKIRKGDRVRVIDISQHEDYKGREKFLNATGTIVDIDNNYPFPYTIKFDYTDIEDLSNKNGGLLWQMEQLEFYFDVKNTEEDKVKITKNDLEFLVDTLENNINSLITQKRGIEREIDNVVYSLSTLQQRIIKTMKEMD